MASGESRGNFFLDLLKKSNSCGLSQPQETINSSISFFKSRLEEIPSSSSSSSVTMMSPHEYELWKESICERLVKSMEGFVDSAEEVADFFSFLCTVGAIFCIGGYAYYLYGSPRTHSDRRNNNSNGLVGTGSSGVSSSSNNGNNSDGGSSSSDSDKKKGRSSNSDSDGNKKKDCSHCNSSSSSNNNNNKED